MRAKRLLHLTAMWSTKPATHTVLRAEVDYIRKDMIRTDGAAYRLRFSPFGPDQAPFGWGAPSFVRTLRRRDELAPMARSDACKRPVFDEHSHLSWYDCLSAVIADQRKDSAF